MKKSLPDRNVEFVFPKDTFSDIINGNDSSPDSLIYIARSYFSESGKHKTTLLVPSDMKTSDILYDQLQRYKSICVIDTNTKETAGVSLSVSCAAYISIEYIGDNKWRDMVLTRMLPVLSISDEGNPEVSAWYRFIKFICSKTREAIALVVDSDLGNIPKYNARELPIYHEFYLPDNIELIYASSERDLASPLNKAINICDEDAKRILTLVINNEEALNAVIQKIKASPCGAVSITPKKPNN